jgi:hypothetical protein
VGFLVLFLQFAANAVLVWFGLSHPAMGHAGRVALGAGYAFAPFLVALLFTGLLTKHYTNSTTRNAFRTNLEIMWGLTLVVAVVTLMVSLEL